MTKFFSTLTLFFVTATAQAAIIGNPFLPEIDSRFDAVEGNSVINASPGNHQQQLAVGYVDFSKCTASSTVAAGCSLGVSLPANAVIRRSWLWVVNQLTALNGATLAVMCQNNNDIFTATTNLSLVSTGLPIDGIATGASTVFKSITRACNVSTLITGNSAGSTITAGKLEAYIEYFLHR